MADALVSVVLEKLTDVCISIALGKLADVVDHRQQTLLFAADDLEKLSCRFKSILPFLHDADRRQVGDESVGRWLSGLRGAAYAVEDVLEEGLVSGLEKDGSDKGDRRNKVCACLLSPYDCLDHAVSRYKVARRIKDIRKTLDQIAKDMCKLHFTNVSNLTSSVLEEDSKSSVTSGPVLFGGSVIYGRQEDKETVISRLVSGSSYEDGQVQVVSIIGIGGLGKTTLARIIYSDGMVLNHFKDALYWVRVSEDFDVTRLMQEILEQVEGKSSFFSELRSLKNSLLQALRGKRFLLVLDDVWNEDEEKWEMLRLALKSGARGSRILVTTRTKKVAIIMNAAYIHSLKGLSNDDSWRLFASLAFDGRSAAVRPELEEVGKEIVSKCRGVPLSIKMIGHMLNFKRTLGDWLNTLESIIWSLQEARSIHLPALLLSYDNLPGYLKQCFAYCSIYQGDALMVKGKLVKLWVTQGFIQSQGNREAEDIGAKYFDDLVSWSMFQEVSGDGNKTTCRMHDLVRDLARFITRDETDLFMVRSKQLSINVRHASVFFTDNDPSILIASLKPEKLRTLFLDGVDKIDRPVVDFFRKARFLRALCFSRSVIERLPKTIGKLKALRYLDLSGSRIVEVPNGIGELKQLRYLDLPSSVVKLSDDIGKLKHLRYLDLSCSKMVKLPHSIGELEQLRLLDLSYSYIVELPESMGLLLNLQTLNLSNCFYLPRLPRGIGGMVSLRHLEIDNTHSLEYLPKGLGRISSLQTLCKFIVGGEGGCEINELRFLNSLQGDIEIRHLERVSSAEEASRAELTDKSDLRRLLLEISGGDEDRDRMDSILQALRPHENLEELGINCNTGSKLPSWIENSSFSKLSKLIIDGFVHCTHLPGLGKLSALKYLEMRNIGIKKVGYEFYYGNSNCDIARREVAFPKLEQLFLLNMSEFGGWDSKLEVDAEVTMPSLRVLHLQCCPKLEVLPDYIANTLMKLKIEGCDRIEGTGCSFPLLEEFTLIKSSNFFSSVLPDIPKLKEFHIERMGKKALPEEGWEGLVALQSLYVSQCDKLKSLPNGLRQLQLLENLNISSCNEMASLPDGLGQLNALKSLTIHYLEVLTFLPDKLGKLQSLRELVIEGCSKLESLPDSLGQLKALKLLKIWELESLACLPEGLGQLQSLKTLTISSCEKLESLTDGLGQLEALESLNIYHLEALTCLPQGLGQLQSLKELKIKDCNKLGSLPDGLVRQLKHLWLSSCKTLCSLPHRTQDLPLLEELRIKDCPLLRERGMREEGEDWPSHIRFISIDGSVIRDEEVSSSGHV